MFFPRQNPPDIEKGWHQYKARNFKVVQKFAPVEPTYEKFDKELIARSLRMESKVKPKKVLKQLNFETKSDYLKKAKMVLVFHNYGLNAQENKKVRTIAKHARCEWIQNKTLGGLYTHHLKDNSLLPLLRDGSAVIWAAYTTDELAYILKSVKKYIYSFRLVAGILANPDAHAFKVLMPSQLETVSTMPPFKEYVGNNLLGPMLAQPYALTGMLLGPIAELFNLLQFYVFKQKEKEGGGKEPTK